MTTKHKPMARKAPNFLTMKFDIVTIRIGNPEEAVDISVYSDILAAVSPYFRGAFEGYFKEAIDRVVPLTDVSEQTFRIFLQWAHTQTGQHSSEVSVPGPGVLHPNRLTNSESTTTNATSHAERVDGNDQSNRDRERYLELYGLPRSYCNPEFDLIGMNSFPKRLVYKEAYEQYYGNAEWLARYRSTMTSYLRLYIFADKYNVHQLRDDIMTAMLGRSFAWNWWSDPDDGLISFAYDNLPKSSKFLRYLVLSAAFLWLSGPDMDCATKLRAMRDIHPDFAFEVSLAQAQRLQNHFSGKGGIPFEQEDCIPDSCVFHEHLVYSKDECRKRTTTNTHIFTSIIGACVEDGLNMRAECGEDQHGYGYKVWKGCEAWFSR